MYLTIITLMRSQKTFSKFSRRSLLDYFLLIQIKSKNIISINCTKMGFPFRRSTIKCIVGRKKSNVRVKHSRVISYVHRIFSSQSFSNKIRLYWTCTGTCVESYDIARSFRLTNIVHSGSSFKIFSRIDVQFDRND